MALTATELDLKKNQKRLDASVMALEALRNVIKNNSGINCASVTLTCHAVCCLGDDCVTGQKCVCSCFACLMHCGECQSNSSKIWMILIRSQNSTFLTKLTFPKTSTSTNLSFFPLLNMYRPLLFSDDWDNELAFSQIPSCLRFDMTDVSTLNSFISVIYCCELMPLLKGLSHGILSYFGHIQNYLWMVGNLKITVL